ncbi:probable inactive receptor kinase At5g10020 [Rhodamnia argentea]|uniref:Probable inactive receptor kinase At5g10020 n=1 Tax=Rhodamnia argentea TaxID=178133 RepID=A0A8B8NJL8_9MYRT|nr:probable inactive receptor kinase At5g10020 [Rhodamnia argentea]
MQMICLIICLLIVNALAQSDLEALLELKKGFQRDRSGQVLDSWDSKSLASDGCPQNWHGVTCSEGRVTSLVLDDVGLIGKFSLVAVSGLAMLQNLSVSNNQLTGTVSEISSGLDQLKYLDLHGNGFSGDVTKLLSVLGSIEYVHLSHNQLSGSLDLVLGNSSFVSSIRYLNVSSNALVGELFSHDGMPYFDSLEVFDASNNRLVGKIPSFNFVVSLRILRLANNQLSGSFPQALLQESSMILSELDLGDNQLEGPVGSITSATLKKLNLSSNRLSGALPVSVGHCAIIDLSNNLLSGNVSRIQSWGNYVEAIQLSSNSLTGALPIETSQFLRLTSFQISGNLVEGTLPQVLGTYPELKVVDLSLNQLSGSLLPSLFSSTKLTDLNLSGNNFTGSLPLEENLDNSSVGSAQNFSLSIIDLSNNSLSGSLPWEINRFRYLVYLDLSRNYFEGGLPDDLPDELQGFNVSYNNFSGTVPENLRRFPDSAFHPGNSMLVFPYSRKPPKGPADRIEQPRRHRMRTAIKIALIAGLVVGACMIALLCFIILRSRKRKAGEDLKGDIGKSGRSLGDSAANLASSPQTILEPPSSSVTLNPDQMPSAQMGFVPQTKSNSSVAKATKDLSHPERKDERVSSPMSLLSSSNPSPSSDQCLPESPNVFRVGSPDKLDGDLHLFDGSFMFTAGELSRAPAEVMGRSCHGTSYKATLDSGHVLVVKWLREGIAKGRKDFAREVKKLGSIKHPNLVSIRGYYWGPKEHEKLIISNFINAASLDLYLQEKDPKKLPSLPLDTRLRIAVDVARCLNFLHNEKAIPHGNLKSTNILLEAQEFNALVTDYSLHRIMTPCGTTEQVLNSGALGYRPPEFASSSKPWPSLKSDVYAFGVILLELLTGRSSGEIICGDPGVVDLTDWVRLMEGKGRCNECYDRRILEAYDTEEDLPRVPYDMLQVALRCILPASDRPDIKTVFEDLASLQP